MLYIILIVLILSLISKVTDSVRNHKEEAICQPFLTSQKTSPLKNNLNRNLDEDEEGEFACELVLQDETLPIQIRFTIHEGLSWLMTRHIQMGLDRHTELVRHLRILAEIMPSSHDFNLRAGYWGLDPDVNEPELAILNLHNCVYGKASEDTKATEREKLDAKKLYSTACNLLGRADEYNKLLIEIENDSIQIEKNEKLNSDSAPIKQKPNKRNFAVEGGYPNIILSESEL